MSKKDRTKKIVIDLTRQVLIPYQTGDALFALDCVSGDEDHPTPQANFRVIRKEHPCFSREFKLVFGPFR